jgi:hypothetical protein
LGNGQCPTPKCRFSGRSFRKLLNFLKDSSVPNDRFRE